jgi:hypothetical protein
MKSLALLFLIFGALNASCQKQNDAGTPSPVDETGSGRARVSAHRELREQTDIAAREWSIDYSDAGVLLTTSYGTAGMHYIMVTHQEVPKLQEALRKFVEWEKVAKQNNVKELEKKLVVLQPDQRLYFIVEDTGRALVRGPNGHFLADDLQAYGELLKAIPELKAELAQLKAKGELFK